MDSLVVIDKLIDLDLKVKQLKEYVYFLESLKKEGKLNKFQLNKLEYCKGSIRHIIWGILWKLKK